MVVIPPTIKVGASSLFYSKAGCVIHFTSSTVRQPIMGNTWSTVKSFDKEDAIQKYFIGT
jgi:hypothetical protein